MRVEEILRQKEAEYRRLLDQIRALDAQRQMLYEELLRVEGELRLLRTLKEVAKDGGSEGVPDKNE